MVSFQGFDSWTKNFMISKDFPNVNLNTIYMDRKGTTLEEVVVQGPPILIKKDTVEFKADAFKVKPNANAEDVLKKIPGVQVDKDGNVTAQGETVQKVYVDGKEFFGTDPKMATKNITADMIESIQVFDDMSDQAKFTKIDDGSRAKTINIKLKKDKRQGYFGRIMGGYGSDERYESTISFNKFNGDQRWSIVGGSNNINKSTFSFNDVVTQAGGFGSRGSGGMGGGAGFGGSNTVMVGGGGNRGGAAVAEAVEQRELIRLPISVSIIPTSSLGRWNCRQVIFSRVLKTRMYVTVSSSNSFTRTLLLLRINMLFQITLITITGLMYACNMRLTPIIQSC